MPRMARYKRDFREQGRRYRLTITPAYPIKFSATAVVPAWGATPATWDGSDNVYIDIPARVIYGTTATAAQFEKLPINWPDSPSMKVGIKLNYLTGTALADLKDYILKPNKSDGGLFDLYNSETAVYETSTCWMLESDMGDSTKTINQFETIFLGAQRRLPVQKHNANKKTGRKKIELEVQHLSRMIFEAVKPEHVKRAMFNATYKAVSGPHTDQFESAYTASSRTYTFSHANHTSLGTYRAFYIRLIDLYRTINDLATCAFADYTRFPSVAFAMLSAVGTNPASDDTGGPLDALQFYRQTYTASGVKGAVLGRDELYFLAWVQAATTLTFGDDIGGYLSGVGRDPLGIYKYRNLYDWLRDASETGHAKVIIRNPVPDGMNIYFAREKEATPTVGALVLAASDFKGEEADFSVGANALVGVNASISGMGGADESEVKVSNPNYGILAEEEGSIAVVFHSSPVIGDDSTIGFGVAVNGGPVATSNTGFIVNQLAYIGNPFGTGDAPIRPHHSVEVHDGSGYQAYCEDTIALPTTGAFSIGDDKNGLVENNFMLPLRGAYAVMQESAGMTFAVVTRGVLAFGGENQTIYEGEVPIEQATLENLGNRTDATAWPDGTIFEKSGSDYADVPGAPTVLSQELDIKTGWAKCKFLATTT